MENTYGIGVKNKFDLFYDDDLDPQEILNQQEEEKERRKTEKGLPKEKTKPTKAGKAIPSGPAKKGKETPQNAVPKPTEAPDVPGKPRNRPMGDRSSNKPITDDKDNMEERKTFNRNRDDQQQQQVSNDQRWDRPDGDRRGRGGGGGFRGRGRGGVGSRGGRGGFFDSRKRDFDRHSGSDKTGVRHQDKRDGGGSKNWGSPTEEMNTSDSKGDTTSTWDDLDSEFQSNVQKDDSALESSQGTEAHDFHAQEVVAETTGDQAAAETNESKENVPVDETAEEIAVPEMTFEEWKREQEGKRVVPKFNLRKPGEGEECSQWKKGYVLKKKDKVKEDDDDEEEEDEEDVDDEESVRRGRQRQLVDIQINFNDSRRGRGRGRGGRGGMPPRNIREDRGDRGPRDAGSGPPESHHPRGPGRMNRGASKMNKAQQSAPKVDDWNDFPSLVTA